MPLNGLNWENNAFSDSFFNFSPREQKKCSFSADVFWIPPTFSPLTSLHYSRFGSLRLPRGAVTSSARPPQRGPRPSLRTPQPSLQTTRPFAPFVPFRSFRKVVRYPKKSLRTSIFSVLSSEKKKNQRTLINLFFIVIFLPFLCYWIL